jgi:hypothetical protein
MPSFSKTAVQILTALILSVGAALPALAADAAGNWAVTFNTAQGGGTMNLIIEQAGADLKGSVSGDVGNAPILGKIENDAVTFSHELPDYGVTAAYTGKLDGDTIKGTVSFADGAATGDFTAQRKQ